MPVNLIASAVVASGLVVVGLVALRRARPTGRFDYRPLGALAVFIGSVTLAGVIVSLVLRGPRVDLQGYLTMTLVGNRTCVFVDTEEPSNPVWTIVELPAGYSAAVEKFDPSLEPGAGRITGPDGTVARYLDFVKLEGVPMPAASNDVCGVHPGVSLLTIESLGVRP